jgi:hypothetical protein
MVLPHPITVLESNMRLAEAVADTPLLVLVPVTLFVLFVLSMARYVAARRVTGASMKVAGRVGADELTKRTGPGPGRPRAV